MTLRESFPTSKFNELFPDTSGYRHSTDGYNPNSVDFSLQKFDERFNLSTIGKFRITLMPGNFSVLIFSHAHLEEAFRGSGVGVKLHELRLEWAKNYRASMVLCTVLTENDPQNRILNQYGWVLSPAIKNPITGNEFAMWYRTEHYPDPVAVPAVDAPASENSPLTTQPACATVPVNAGQNGQSEQPDAGRLADSDDGSGSGVVQQSAGA